MHIFEALPCDQSLQQYSYCQDDTKAKYVIAILQQ